MAQNSNISKGLLIGFLKGSIVGAAVALLYAPKSGKELRQDIKGKTDEFIDEAEKFIDTAKEKAKNTINDGKRKAEQLISDAKVKADVLLKDADKVLQDAKSKTTELVQTGKETVEAESSRLKTAFKAGVDAYKETKNT